MLLVYTSAHECIALPPGSVQFVCHTWIHGIVVLTAPYVHQWVDNKYVGPPYYHAEMYSDPIHLWRVSVSMLTGQSDRRTDARPLHYAFRYGRGQRNDSSTLNPTWITSAPFSPEWILHALIARWEFFPVENGANAVYYQANCNDCKASILTALTQVYAWTTSNRQSSCEASYYFAYGWSAKCCNQRVCLSVCPLACLKNHMSQFYEIFCTC